MAVHTLKQRWEVGLRWKKKIIFLDEAHLDLDGYVNKQNCRIWGTENPDTHKSRRTQNESLFGADFSSWA